MPSLFVFFNTFTEQNVGITAWTVSFLLWFCKLSFYIVHIIMILTQHFLKHTTSSRSYLSTCLLTLRLSQWIHADAATLWWYEVNTMFSPPSCDWSHWDPSVHWPELPDIWQQRYPEKVGSEMGLIALETHFDVVFKNHGIVLVVWAINEQWSFLFFRVSGSRTNLFMRFKSTAKDGLLLWRGDSPMRTNSDYLSMGLQDGALIFRYLFENCLFSHSLWNSKL